MGFSEVDPARDFPTQASIAACDTAPQRLRVVNNCTFVSSTNITWLCLIHVNSLHSNLMGCCVCVVLKSQVAIITPINMV